jgi:hypothetical protein
MDYLAQHRRIVVERFPRYAGDLNPVDKVWFYVKLNRLPNYTPPDTADLRRRVHSELVRLGKRPDLLRSLFARTGLPISPARRAATMSKVNMRTETASTRKYLALDIETAKVLPATERDCMAYRPLGISCAATLLSDSGGPVLWYGVTGRGRPAARMTRPEARRMINYLARKARKGYTIVTWNGVGFDFDILAEETAMVEVCQLLAANHIDMMFHAVCLLGHAIGLDAAAKGMNLRGKAEGITGALAPILWAQGRQQKVLEYVSHDVRSTLELARACEAAGFLRWVTRNGRRRKTPLSHGWLTVKAAAKLPAPTRRSGDGLILRRRLARWLNEAHGSLAEVAGRAANV